MTDNYADKPEDERLRIAQERWDSLTPEEQAHERRELAERTREATKPKAKPPRKQPPAPPTAAWMAGLIRKVGAKGPPKAHLANASLALREAPEWRGVLAYDDLRMTIELADKPPWVTAPGMWKPRPWCDEDDVRTAIWLQQHGIDIGHSVAHAAVAEVAAQHRYHPVQRYLTSLRWDGVERVSVLAHEYFGAEDTPLNRSISSAALIAAVARAMSPGCKADCMVVLEGPQGKLKSTVIEALFGRDWFTDDLADLGTKEAAMQIGRVWAAEVSELSALRRSEIEAVKAFLSRRVDIFRPPYGRALIERPRQSVMWGTTNASEWLDDETGARRFWPISVGRIDIERLRRDRDDLWAEAVQRWTDGEPWWLVDQATVDLASEAQAERQIVDAWEERIADYVGTKRNASVAEILQHALGLDPSKWDRGAQMRVARWLKKSGWVRKLSSTSGGRKWRYFAPDDDDGQMGMDI